MNRSMMLLSALLLTLPGCESHTWPLRYPNSAVADAKQGEDCRYLVFGMGHMPDMSGTKAMRLGSITMLRSTEYQVNTLQGVGRECIIAHGE
ncbi:hypothetical protein [Nitrospira japonica]|nr:hypothetical protein [Nitrospira japonica]